MAEILALGLAIGVFWFWYDSMRAREAAVRMGRNACGERGLQFLDETVAIARLRIRRDSNGRLVLARLYAFEFSDTGDNRRNGSIALLGQRVESLQLEPYRLQ